MVLAAVAGLALVALAARFATRGVDIIDGTVRIRNLLQTTTIAVNEVQSFEATGGSYWNPGGARVKLVSGSERAIESFCSARGARKRELQSGVIEKMNMALENSKRAGKGQTSQIQDSQPGEKETSL